jgi:predicted MFS family arabinose efflux permease
VLRALRVHGVMAVLVVTLVFVIAHTILYTYVSPYLDGIGMGGAAGAFLLVFGVASLVGVLGVGARVDTSLRALTTASVVLVIAACVLLITLHTNVIAVYLAALLWGLGWGGVPTLLQTAVGDAGGKQADSAQALLVVLWNVAMAGGGVLGGLQVDIGGTPFRPGLGPDRRLHC